MGEYYDEFKIFLAKGRRFVESIGERERERKKTRKGERKGEREKE